MLSLTWKPSPDEATSFAAGLDMRSWISYSYMVLYTVTVIIYSLADLATAKSEKPIKTSKWRVTSAVGKQKLETRNC